MEKSKPVSQAGFDECIEGQAQNDQFTLKPTTLLAVLKPEGL